MSSVRMHMGRGGLLGACTALVFSAAGPRPLAAEWRAIGPFGGAVAVVQVDARNPGTVIAATRNALFFRSRNGGDRWEPLPFAPQLHAVLHSFTIRRDGVYLAGLGSDAPAYSGLFRSVDEGRTWNRVAGLASQEIWSVAVWPADEKIMAAGSRDGVYLTRDDGATWNRISPASNRELQPVVSLAFDPADSKVLYAGTPHLPWKTADGGGSWHPAHEGMLDDSDVFSIQVDARAPEHVFATACSGIYFSGNGGGAWTKLAGSASASYRTYVVAQDPQQPDTVFAGTAGGLIRSTDRGHTWKKLSDDAARFVAFDAAHPGRLYVATDQHGILRSDNSGETLVSANEGLCNRYFSAMAAAGDLFAASVYEASSGGVFRLDAGGEQWQRTAPASALFGEQILSMTAPARSGDRFYAAAYRSLLASSDNGRTWIRIPGPPAGSARLTAVVEFSGRLMLASESGLFHSENRGTTWVKAQVPAGVGGIRSLATLDADTLAAVTSAGLILSHDGLVWTAAAAPPGKIALYGVVSPAAGTILAATSGGLMRSSSAGASWEPVSWGPGSSTVSAICIDPGARNHVYAAVYGSVYESGDAGLTWVPVSTKPSGMISIRALALVPGQPGRVYALTQHQGIFLLTADGVPVGISAAASSRIPNPGENTKQHGSLQENK